MKRIFLEVALAALSIGAALSQGPPKSPVFEAADVYLRPVDPFMSGRSESYVNGGLTPSGRYELHRANMADLIQAAYGLQDYELYGGPNWLEIDHYEVVAKVPAGSTKDDLQPMLQALLADRFKLVVHKADQPMEVNALTRLDKAGQLKAAEGTGEPGCRGVRENGGPPAYANIDCQHISMADFARFFASNAGHLPMIDLTGLKGTYDFNLKWTPVGMTLPPGSGAAASPRITFADAVEKQLGLKIVQEKHPIPVLVVDSVNRTPTANVPGVEKILGLPTEFDAASIKPTKPGNPNRRFDLTRGQVHVENIPLRTLIGISQNLFPLIAIRQNMVGSDYEKSFEHDMIVGGPKWLDTDFFDIVAKTDNASPYAPQWLPDDLMVMLRALLAERFKLVTHTEQHTVPVWALVVDKGGPKLTPADPKERSGCKYSGGEAKAGSEIVPVQIYTCQNVTMAQLADSLHAMARAYVDRAAVDMTGLKGGYDVTLQFSTIGVINNLRARTQGASGGAIPEASDTAGGVTLYEALGKFGLKLESGRKAPQPVVVIDHVEPLTEDN